MRAKSHATPGVFYFQVRCGDTATPIIYDANPTIALRRQAHQAHRPLQLGKIMGLTYGIMGLVVCPIFLIISLIAQHNQQQQHFGMMAFGTGIAIILPIFYGAMGFILGVIGAFIYNLIARWVGGIEVEVE